MGNLARMGWDGYLRHWFCSCGIPVMRVAIYARVSTDEQATDNQIAERGEN